MSEDNNNCCWQGYDDIMAIAANGGDPRGWMDEPPPEIHDGKVHFKGRGNVIALPKREREHHLPEIQWHDEKLSDWAEREIPDRRWLVPEWIPREQVTGLYGVGGINKTDFLVQLHLAKSAGLPFLGFKLEPGPTYGLFCEDTSEEIVRRAARISAHYGKSLADFPDFHFASLVGLDDPEFVIFEGTQMKVTEALLRFDRKITTLGAVLATLDTAPHFFGGNEVVRREVTKFLRKLDAISIARGCGMLYTAHPSVRGKSSKTFDSGSTGWEGSARARISIHDPGTQEDDEGDAGPRPATDRRILTRWKANYAAAGVTLELFCRNGIFTPAAVDPEQAAKRQRGPTRDRACEEKFIELIGAVEQQGSYVNASESSRSTYAPRVFPGMVAGKEFSQTEYKRAMARLFEEKRVRLETSGPPSRQRKKLIACNHE